MSVNELLRDNPLRVVDIGASGGIDARWTRFTDHCRGILFEPDPREFEQLRLRASERLVVLNAALGEAPGTVDFHLYRKQETSSVFWPNAAFVERFPQVERFDLQRTVQMPVDTLDNQLRGHGIDAVDFIKIDTQGCELPILRGGTQALAAAVGLQIEVSFSPIYAGQPLFGAVDDFVRPLGFELHDLNTHYWRRRDARSGRGQLVFADAVYFRPPEALLAAPGPDARKVLRAIGVYLAYERCDIARVLAQGADTLPAPQRGAALSAIAAVERRVALREALRLARPRRALAKLAKRLGLG